MAARTLVIVIGISLALAAACSSSAAGPAAQDVAVPPSATASSGQQRIPPSTTTIIADCIDPVSQSLGSCPRPGQRLPTEATRLLCTAELDPANLGFPILRARLTLAGSGRPVAGQLVRWELPAALHGAGGRPDAATNAEGIASLGLAAAPGPVAVSTVIVARFTDPPPHVGRSSTLADAECSVSVQIQRSG